MRREGSFRVMFALVEVLGLGRASPLRPVRPLSEACHQRVEYALGLLLDAFEDQNGPA